MAQILPRGKLWLRLLDLGPLSRGATGGGRNPLFYLNVLLSPDKHITYFGYAILHQMFAEGVGDLQPTDEGGSGYVLIAIVHEIHLALKVINIALQTLSNFHLDCEEVVVVPLEFSSRNKLIVECVGYFMKVSGRFPQERVKLVVGDFLDAG